MSTPKISIIIPAYNCSKTIGNCLESIFNQTFKDFEVVVINDGSKEDLGPALKPWTGKIKYVEQENQGAPAARNRGFAESVGQFVIFLDSDIVAKPDMLEKLMAMLEKHGEASYAYSSFLWGWKKFRLFPFSADRLRQMPYIHTSALVRREHFPGFDLSLKKFQDWDLWLTMLEQGHVGVWLDEVLFKVTAAGTMSSWLPSFVYKLPLVKSKAKDKYFNAEEIIKKKHGIA